METRKWANSFQQPWNEMIARVINAGRTMGSTTLAQVRSTFAPSIAVPYAPDTARREVQHFG